MIGKTFKSLRPTLGVLYKGEEEIVGGERTVKRFLFLVLIIFNGKNNFVFVY